MEQPLNMGAIIWFLLLVIFLLGVVMPAAFWLISVALKQLGPPPLPRPDGYVDFLHQYEGAEFFCYPDHPAGQPWVETHILPQLNPNIHAVLLTDEGPRSDLPNVQMAYLVQQARQDKFPNVMKIKYGRLVDSTLHREFFDILNRHDPPAEFLYVINERLEFLRLPRTT